MDLAFKLSSHCKLFRHFSILTFKLFLRSWRQVKMQIAREMLFFFLVSIGTTKIQFFWSPRNFPWEQTTWNDLESQGCGRVSRTLLHILAILQYQCGCMVFALFQSVVQSTYWSILRLHPKLLQQQLSNSLLAWHKAATSRLIEGLDISHFFSFF